MIKPKNPPTSPPIIGPRLLLTLLLLSELEFNDGLFPIVGTTTSVGGRVVVSVTCVNVTTPSARVVGVWDNMIVGGGVDKIVTLDSDCEEALLLELEDEDEVVDVVELLEVVDDGDETDDELVVDDVVVEMLDVEEEVVEVQDAKRV